ncbi:MAG: Pantetheine-phosphate adenylyltransferase [Candidatus Uhrbacteria bacterium GW2011_GWE2_40_58]|nr:MAG: Pantetheine-phosphate adenylyltransferase [Candidatus Uhrbacteria bacterium GW2011_GWF2_40_263]KKR67561.1 MAG: Pantetheine-phosphate adenylyltransferase [Candidatus Uhrbacteria bacterium GW2011_GWE2_40_58]
MKYQRGLVALSADPLTFGHIDLVRKAAAFCEQVIVLIAINDVKRGSYLFSLNERVAMTKRALREIGLRNVRVIGSEGLLIDVYLKEGCDALIRGIRNADDRIYEETQMTLHTLVLPELKGHIEFIDSEEHLRLLSSSMVKAFASHHLDVSAFVPLFVKQALEERLLHQYKIAVTGAIAVGKSFVAKQLVEHIREKGHLAHHLNMDQLIREVYVEDSAGAQKMREALATLLGDDVLTEQRHDVNRKVLAQRLFATNCPKETREQVERLTSPHVMRKYREFLNGKEGLIVLEWAQLAEMCVSHWTNHHVVVVDSPDKDAFAAMRGIDEKRREELSKIQLSALEKVETLRKVMQRDQQGTVLCYQNHLSSTAEETQNDLVLLVDHVLHLFPALSQESS